MVEILDNRDDTLLGRRYLEKQERRYDWGQALRCNCDWNSDLSRSLMRLFGRSGQILIRLSEMQDDGKLKRAFKSSVPEVLTVEYTDEKGEIRYKTFLAACHSAEDVTRRDCASDESTPISSTPEELVAGSSSSESRLEYKDVLEYRDINRHARRKIEAWLNDGWSVEWEWYGGTFGSGHYMTLRRLASDDGLPFFPSPSNKRIVLELPTTPEEP